MLWSAGLATFPLFFVPILAQGGDPNPDERLVLPTPRAVGELPTTLSRFAFVENLGQWNTSASFVASLGRTVLRAEERGFVVDARPEADGASVSLRFELEGARPGVDPVGAHPRSGVRNYLRGNDPERWIRGAHAFAQVVYAGLYEGVDLRLREADGMPEYDLLLAPGADLAQVVIRCSGTTRLEVDDQGGLLMHHARGVLRQTPPATWCVLPSGEQEPLACEYVVLDEARFGFRLADHDGGLPVVIDPGLEWATYLGGSGTDWLLGMARNSLGEIIVVGTTFSLDFPTTVGTVDYPGPDVFVSVLSPSGSALVASTLLGGSGTDWGLDVQVGASDEVYVVGTTNSSDFPTTPLSAWFPGPQGKFDGFVVQLAPDLSGLDYASYLGGSEFDCAGSLRVHGPGVLTIAGATRSTNFPGVTPLTAVQPSYAGGLSDYFLCRIDLDQASPLLYGTYLGGSADDGVSLAPQIITFKDPQIHEDASGIVTIAGRTESNDIVRTAVGYDTSFNSLSSTDEDAYLAIVDPSESGLGGLVYDTYLGAEMRDAARALVVDSEGVVTVGGFTDSPSFPTTQGAFQTTFIGPTLVHDGFIARLDPSEPPAQQLLYSTFLAGDGYENVLDLVLDSRGRIVAQGYTGDVGLVSNRFPTTPYAFQRAYAGNNDGMLVYLNPAGTGAHDLLYSTFLGGSGWDIRSFGLEILSESSSLHVLSAGGSGAFGFPATFSGAYQSVPSGLEDGLLLQLEIPVKWTGRRLLPRTRVAGSTGT